MKPSTWTGYIAQTERFGAPSPFPGLKGSVPNTICTLCTLCLEDVVASNPMFVDNLDASCASATFCWGHGRLRLSAMRRQPCLDHLPARWPLGENSN